MDSILDFEPKNYCIKFFNFIVKLTHDRVSTNSTSLINHLLFLTVFLYEIGLFFKLS